jgi:hypothetical protein
VLGRTSSTDGARRETCGEHSWHLLDRPRMHVDRADDPTLRPQLERAEVG